MIDLRNNTPHYSLKKSVELGINPRNFRRWLASILVYGIDDPSIWVEQGILTKRFASSLSALTRLKLERQVVSPIDTFQKLIFRSSDNLSIESVIIPLKKKDKVTICLSSQVGCVMGCVFCATARMAKRRNLETWEIIDQFVHARQIVHAVGKKISGVVFMGMGEPFLNYDNVMAAADLLCFPILDAVSAKAITISTVGLVQEIDRFTSENRSYRLSISLGAASDEKRAKLVPIASRTPVKKVIEAARRYALARRDRVMLSYVCISGVNVSIEDARALSELIMDTPVRLDLIEVTDPTGRFLKPSSEEMRVFRDALSLYLKQPVVRRYSGGGDIQAACGTLAGG